MPTNEQKGLDAAINPSSLTLGKLARLERIKSPLLSANFNSLIENLKALYSLTLTASEFYTYVNDIEAKASEWAETLPPAEYEKQMDALCRGLVDFGILMPRPDEEASKKNGSVTAG